ncbi:cytochrome P450 [Pseudonocardia sp. TRM90224]|uniref:cytochrome P450 n=1 Tax=Pseudonocardia sp. TRM90224 TaxID=2812678 RepID=UPI001E60B94D|nr:cytochrome P450 [Pseudonocardia sp. TRM90224]
MTLSELPIERTTRFDPPAELMRLPPVARMTYPDGHLGWLVTDHAAAKIVLSDARFSSRQELRHAPVRANRVGDTPLGARPGWFVNMDGAQHARYRRLLAGEFTVRRTERLRPRITEIVDDHIDALVAAGPPVDLVSAFAFPVPSLVICELLGVPYEDHPFFQTQTSAAARFDTPPADAAAAMGALYGYLAQLVESRRRGRQQDDLLGGLIAAGDLDDEELTNIALILLVAGHETTANMIGLGMLALFEHPEQLTTLRAKPGLVDNAVEELLRYLTILHAGAPFRAALADVELAGQLIEAGETVTVSLPAADRDPTLFPDPAELRLDRPGAQRHLAFGHGLHMCLGHALARMELRIAYRALLDRLPGLQPAVPTAQVRLRLQSAVLGVEELPVTWDQ